MDLLEKVKANLNIGFNDDDTLIAEFITAAIAYAEEYQHLATGYYASNDMPATTEQAVVMLASHFYDSRDGAGQNADAIMTAVNRLLGLNKCWTV